MQDYISQIENEKENYNLTLVCKYHKNHNDDDVSPSLIVEGDKGRIIQVISNLKAVKLSLCNCL